MDRPNASSAGLTSVSPATCCTGTWLSAYYTCDDSRVGPAGSNRKGVGDMARRKWFFAGMQRMKECSSRKLRQCIYDYVTGWERLTKTRRMLLAYAQCSDSWIVGNGRCCTVHPVQCCLACGPLRWKMDVVCIHGVVQSKPSEDA